MDTLTNKDVQQIFPDLDVRKAEVALIDGRIYKNEHGCWRQLDDRINRSIAEFTGTEGDSGRCRVRLIDGSA